MPFLSNITDLKSLTRQFDVLGVFGDQPVPTADKVDGSQSGEKVASTSTPYAIAGPGPSTRALSEDKNATLTLPSPTSRPVRPSLKSTPSSSLSFDEEAGRRRTSNNSVTIVDPVNGPLDRKAGADTDAIQTKRRSGPNSIASAVGSGMPLEARRRRRAPLDTYIIVRPPPTSAKNPLNLQIQLVVKDTRTRDRSVSAVSTRSNSVSTDASASSVPVTPATPSSELPPRDSSSFELPSALKQRSASPAQMSSDDAEETDGAPLRRTTSLGSNVSSNTSSTATSGGHRKRVEPMFNLAVHSVMQPTVVTDASTDAKVAKFLKRALDVNGVGILEPAEVWLPPSNAPSSANLVPPTDNFQPRSRPVSMMSLTVPLSPTTTRQSELTSANIRNSLDLAFKRTSMELSQVKNSVNPEGGAKKFFGKMFKKKTATETASVPADSRKSLTITRKRSHSPSPPSGEVVGPVDEHGHHHYGHSTFGTAPVVIRRRSSGTMVTSDGAITGLTAPSVPPPSAGLGLSPPSLTDNCTTLPLLPSTRPVGYTWSVKKWAKRNSEGWAAHLVAAAAAGLDLVHGGFAGEGDDQVVFEWVKMRSPANTAGSSYLRRITTNNTAASAASRPVPKKKRSRTASLRGDVSPGLEPESAKLAVTPNPTSRPTSPRASPRMDPRPEPVRRVSASLSSSSRRNSSAPPSIIESEKDQDASSIDSPDLTADEESDPEDSETPWTCSVWVKKTGQRQLLGTLTPAPHHPKVIAALKIPMTLDTVSLTSINPPTTTAHAEAAKRVEAEVCLTEENLKDVVCVTAMWLAAREEFGGLGRKKRSVKC